MVFPACSVIVPTYNRLDNLKKCLASLLELNFNNFEIIIVNDASTDNTKSYLGMIKNDKLKVINNTYNLGKSLSRNEGIKIAKYDIIAFTDDDCLVDKNWLNNLSKIFAEEILDFVYGQTFYIRKGYKGYFPERLVNVLNWPGAGNIAYHKRVFTQIGGFDKLYDNYNNEDSELAIRAIANNFKGKLNTEAIVYHQAVNWTVKSLLRSAKNAAVWPILKKKYSKYYLFFKPPVKLKIFVNPIDYLYFLILPILIPALLIRYLMHGKRDLKIFFTKWPIYLFLRRYYIYQEALKNKVLML